MLERLQVYGKFGSKGKASDPLLEPYYSSCAEGDSTVAVCDYCRHLGLYQRMKLIKHSTHSLDKKDHTRVRMYYFLN